MAGTGWRSARVIAWPHWQLLEPVLCHRMHCICTADASAAYILTGNNESLLSAGECCGWVCVAAFSDDGSAAAFLQCCMC